MIDIIDALRKWGEIEQYSCNSGEELFSRFPDLITVPPLVVWRYVNPTPQLAKRLTSVIGSFQGNVEWMFLSKGENWSLCPALVKNRSDLSKLQKLNPGYGICANNELPKLAEHIRRASELTSIC